MKTYQGLSNRPSLFQGLNAGEESSGAKAALSFIKQDIFLASTSKGSYDSIFNFNSQLNSANWIQWQERNALVSLGVSLNNSNVFIVINPRTCVWLEQQGINDVREPYYNVSTNYLSVFEDSDYFNLVFSVKDQIYIFAPRNLQFWNVADYPDSVGRNIDDSEVASLVTVDSYNKRLIDSSQYSNDGSIFGAAPLQGKFGGGLHFDGLNDYVSVPYSPSLNFTSALSVEAWVYPLAVGVQSEVIGRAGQFMLRLDSSSDRSTVSFFVVVNGVYEPRARGVVLPVDEWSFVVGTYDGFQVKIYVNGQLVGSAARSGVMDNRTNPVTIGNVNGNFYNGTIDEVNIYNRTLSAGEVTALYSQPDPAIIANYYNYHDAATNNTMLIHIDNADANNIALVTCTDFFADSGLIFQANKSAIINVWTNLGQPVFTTGIWNAQNYTTTLMLDPTSSGELNWNLYNITTYTDMHSGVSPSNVTVGYGGSQTLNFNATQGYSFNVAVDGVSQGQISNYTFSNLSSPHTINVTSSILRYAILASADSHLTINPVGTVLVNYNSSQLFTIQPDAGYTIEHVYVDSVDKGAFSNYTFSNIQSNHTISVTTSIINFTVAASAGSNGVISPDGSVSVSYGQTQTFIFIPEPGYHVSQVLVDNISKSIADSYTFSNVQKNYTINVSFAINIYKITTYTDARSVGSPSNASVSYGGSQTLNFNAAQGYGFDVSIDDISQGQISSYTFSNVTTPHTVNVTSVLLKFTVSASADVGSTISPSGDVSVNYGGSQLFLIQNRTGYNVTHVYIDGIDNGAISNYTFSNVTANHVITVSSEKLPTPSSTPTVTPLPTDIPSPTPMPSSDQTNSPSPTPTSQSETNQFPTQTTLIGVIIGSIIIMGIWVFKKGYITIEIVNEQENPQEKPAKEKDVQVSPDDEALDY